MLLHASEKRERQNVRYWKNEKEKLEGIFCRYFGILVGILLVGKKSFSNFLNFEELFYIIKDRTEQNKNFSVRNQTYFKI